MADVSENYANRENRCGTHAGTFLHPAKGGWLGNLGANCGHATLAPVAWPWRLRPVHNPVYEATVDLPERLEALATHYGRKGTSPSMPFASMTEDGKVQWPVFDGVMDFNTFKAKVDENIEALFNEMKLRTLIMVAREHQMDDTCRSLKTIQGERDVLYKWCTTFSKELPPPTKASIY